MQLHTAQTTLPLYIVRVNLTRNLVVCRVSNEAGEGKNMSHIFILDKRRDKEVGQQIQGNIIHTQEQIMKLCAGVIWLRIENIDEFV